MDDMQYLIKERCSKLVANFEKNYQELENDKKEFLDYLMSEDKQTKLNDLVYEPDEELKESTRITSYKILNSIVPNHKEMFGGSADLFGANKTYVENISDFSHENRSGGNIFFGVREHAMGAILNGLALSGFRPYGSTFLSFSDYMKPAIRLACMMDLPVTYIFSHDSISVGEDGPTHQPIEQLSNLRTIPNLDVFRPADANEVIGTYRAIANKNSGPSAIILSRNTTPILKNTNVLEVEKGGYIVYEPMKKPDGIIISSGEEVHTCLEVAERLQTKGLQVRVVSVPNLIRFLNQDDEYFESVLPVEVRKIVVEAGTPYIWSSIVFNEKNIISVNTYGESGSKDDLYKKFELDADSLEEKIETILK